MATGQRQCWSALAAALVGLVAPAARAADEIRPGAYCPLPEPGEKPQCLEPAQREYGEFFGAVDGGELGDAQTARLETDLASGAEGANAYLALSSLAYGYYRLAQRAAATPGEDPEVVARLERWNALLARAYQVSPDDAPYRDAVRVAALDIQERSPSVKLRCLDAEGEAAACDSTEAVLRALGRGRDETGVRGVLGRLLERLFGARDS